MRFIDLTGQRFGRLTVISRSPEKAGKAIQWFCKCDCGGDATIAISNMKRIQSCGCLKSEIHLTRKLRFDSHKLSNTPTYHSWRAMKQRCLDPKDKDYPRYGGRGISLCDSWLDFKVFVSDMGLRPSGKTIDRINNEDGYSIHNCKWSTAKEQANNRRNSRKATQ